MPTIELGLLGLGVLAAAFRSWLHAERVLLLVGGLIVGSYLHMIVAGFVIGWLKSRQGRPEA